ncbi:efflux RND transporter periplasmic adaptor subunit [Algiphilus sp.]|uniref:efflux RND transporter periplasmic adaptor subunit n=1 Tax=Algiphilus sp. TaxID=1872431 RepID=UPI001CA73D80|nr:efflux RND transporter periplasmic adaptor subunit [Algiphilus sp.]MBY8966730.1 efflux RND transporter periplasmic adaptor subunit [Algiphilus acroporae]MCI5103421.1 efflux RND transporter periplasmic adaptor subunit [Algiphilus sp.]
MTTKRMIIMLVLVGLVFGGVFGMKEFGRRAMVSFLEQMPTPPATVAASEVGTMRWNSRLRSVGSLVAENGTNVTNEAPGIVTTLHFQSGDTVEEGDLLLELDSDTEAAQLARLEAESELAELTRKRRERLFELNSLSKADLDEAVSQANVARAAVKAQRALLEQKRIRAPFSGKLGIRRVSIGQFVDAGTPMVALESVDPMEVDFSLPEGELPKVSPGQGVKVRVDGFPEEVFEGEILALESRVDSNTRNFDVRARLPNADGRLRPGQFARVEIDLPGQREVIVVPRTAVKYNSYGSSVFIVQQDPDKGPPPENPNPNMPPHTDLMVKQRFVELGEARGDFVEVVKGLEGGEKIATTGLLKLRNEMPVIINNEGAPEPKLDPAVSEG